jgi:hypothetical protein
LLRFRFRGQDSTFYFPACQGSKREKTADVFLDFRSTSASLFDFLAGVRPQGLLGFYGFAFQHISQPTSYFTTSRCSVKVFGHTKLSDVLVRFLPHRLLCACAKSGWGALQKLVIEFSLVCPCGRNLFVTHSGLDYTAFNMLVKGF